MKIIVTGTSGFLGNRVAAYYRPKYEVWTPSHREMDVTDEKQVEEAVIGFSPDVIMHCGAISEVGVCEENPELSMQVNVKGSQNLARAAKKAGARFILCSSDQVYFKDKPGLYPQPETEELHPIPVYGQHKLMAEKLCFEEQPDTVALRLTWMYDNLTEQEIKKGRRNLATILTDALSKNEKVTFSSTDYRGITNVNEVVQNLEKAWKLPAGVYNFGSSNDTNMYETVKKVLDGFHREDLLEQGTQEEIRNLTMDTGKIEKEGISFSRTQDGLEKYLKEWMRSF